MHLTRRSALASAAVLAAAACTPKKASTPPVVDPDVALRGAAIERERALLSLYADALAASPSLSARLAPLLADHESHLAVLGSASTPGSASPSRPGSASPSTPGSASTPAGSKASAALLQLKAAERTAAAAHATATLTASRELAATLASLAACEASHVVVL